MRPFFTICMFFCCSSVGVPQDGGTKTLGEIKTWRMTTPHGEIRLKLSSASKGNDRRTVLLLEPLGSSKPTVGEEADLLREVLHQVPSLQYDPSKLELITTWLQNSGFQDGVADAVFHSGKWKSCARQKYCYQAQGVANQFLRSVDAFKEFDTILHEYGLRRKAVRVDNMAVGNEDGKIACQGLIVVSVENEN